MRAMIGLATGAAVMTGVVLLLMVPLFFLLGPERALAGGFLEFSVLWTGIAMVVCLFAATMAGWLAHRIGGLSAVAALVAAAVLFGLADAGYHQLLVAPVPLTAWATLSWYEVLIAVREPLWYDLSLPVLMGLFIWVAGSSREVEQRAADVPVRRTRHWASN